MATLDTRALSGTKQYLNRQGVSLSERATETDICQALFRFLVAHRGDRQIWYGLTTAIEQTGCSRLQLGCKKGREASLSALIGKLSHLRAALPDQESPQGYRDFRRRLGSGVLAVFLMAAMTTTGCYDADSEDTNTGANNKNSINTKADETESTDLLETGSEAVPTGCDDIETDTIPTDDDTSDIETDSSAPSTDDNSESTDSETAEQASDTSPCIPEGQEIPDNQVDDDCDGRVDCYDETSTCRESDPLQNTVAHACIQSGKSMLCDIFDTLDDDWEQGLSAIFENGSTQDIADVLDHLVICAEYTDWVFNGKYDETTAEAIKQKQFCAEMIPIYIVTAIPKLNAK